MFAISKTYYYSELSKAISKTYYYSDLSVVNRFVE